MDDNTLHQRLLDWAAAFGGEQYQRFGYSASERLQAAGDVHSMVAIGSAALSGAQEIECIVSAMEQQGRYKESRVLRAEYFLQALPETDRLQKLQRIGIPLSRVTYYTYLRTARAFLSGALSRQSAPAAA